jgi:hypothetical protein
LEVATAHGSVHCDLLPALARCGLLGPAIPLGYNFDECKPCSRPSNLR